MPHEGADVAVVSRGRAAGPAAHLQQRGGGEGAVPHARGQSTPACVAFTIQLVQPQMTLCTFAQALMKVITKTFKWIHFIF